jgi:hypothetical protein
MAKKQTIIKKPVGNGDISITIENNLKNTNSAPPPVKRRRRRRQLPTTDETNSMIENMLRGGGRGGVNLPPLKDVSYIKPPSNNFTVWRDNFNDSYNTTIPQGQAQQMGMLPLPKVEAPPVAPPSQLALPAPPTADAPLTMREFAAIMMQQGKARPGYQNLHEDPYNDDEPIEERFADLPRAYEKSSDRYANLRPSSRIEEIEEDVLKEAGATNEQIQNYQEQIKQQKAGVSTTNEQKLASVGIDPEIVKKIKASKTAGTMQGTRNIKPYGPYINDPNFIASYNAGRTLWLSQQPEDRKTVKKPENFTFLAKNEDPWDIDYQDADQQQPEDIFHDAKTQTEEEKDAEDMRKIRERLVSVGLKTDAKTQEQRNLEKQNKAASIIAKGFKTQKERKLEKKVNEDIQEIMKERKSAQLINRAVKGRNARKELKELKELEAIQVNQEEQAGKVITKAAQRYQEKKRKKALVEKLKADLEAEIAKLKEELKAGRPQPKMATKKVLSEAMESLKYFWKKDMTEEEARQARKDARQAKKDAQQKTEDKLAAKAKALRDKRKQLEALGK